MHRHRADMIRIFEPDVVPGLAGIHRFVYAVAVGGIAANASLTHARVDHVGIGARHGERAHRAGLKLPIRNRQPGGAPIGSLPDAAASGAEIINVGL